MVWTFFVHLASEKTVMVDAETEATIAMNGSAYDRGQL